MNETIHPRDNLTLYGHASVEASVLQLWQQQRLAGTFLISGLRGIGKATMAYRIARFVLSGGEGDGGGLFGPQNLSIAENHSIIARVAAQSHPDFMVLEGVANEKTVNQTIDIKVEETRKVAGFLSLTPAESSWRVVIIDSADDLNPNAANSLLKVIEEPPAQALMLLVSHNPGRLLPTIRSRCRHLRLHSPVYAEFCTILQELHPGIDTHTLGLLYALSQGAPGYAAKLAHADAANGYQQILAFLAQAPTLPVIDLHRYAEQLADKKAAATWPVWCHIWQMALTRIIRALNDTLTDDLIEGERTLLLRIAALKPLHEWLNLWDLSQKLLGHTARLHLDKKQTVLSLFGAVEGLPFVA